MRLKRIEQIYVRSSSVSIGGGVVDHSTGCRSTFSSWMGYGSSEAVTGHRICDDESAAAEQSKWFPAWDAVSYDCVSRPGKK